MRRHVGYLIGALEFTDELLDEAVITPKQKEKFVDIIRLVTMFNAELDGIDSQAAKRMLEADLEELEEVAGGS